MSAGTILDLENAMCASGDTDLLELPPYLPHARLAEMRRGRLPRPVEPPRRDYDLCLFAIFEPREIGGLGYVRELRRRCARVVVYVLDAWLGHLDRVRRHRRAWALVDEVVVSFPWAVDAYAEATGRPTRYLPQAIDPDRFRPDLEQRSVDVLSLGRRLEPVHHALLSIATKHDLWYHFSESRGAVAIDLDDSQRLVSELCRRATAQVSWPVEVTHARAPRRGFREGDGSPITARWFEAAASASVVLGARPAAPEFTELFPYDAFVREIDPEGLDDLEETVLDVVRTPVDPARVALAQHVRTQHSWHARCRAILGDAATSPTRRRGPRATTPPRSGRS